MNDKETNNLIEISDYLSNKDSYHTGAYTIFKADVTYEARPLKTLYLQQTEVQYQYVDQPAIFIRSLNPPYFDEFRTIYQNFLHREGKLIITGIDKNGISYKVTIS